MSPRVRAIVLVLGTFLFALLAYLPLFRAGLLAEDYAALLRAEGEVVFAPQGEPDDAELSPLAEISLRVSSSLHGAREEAAAEEIPFKGMTTLLRFEHVVLLALAALGLGVATRRFLLPWTGSDHARAAGWSAALLFSVHPLAVPSVASVQARGELLAVVFGAWAIAFFLWSRQDRVRSFSAVSLLLCVLAGLSADVALGLPFVLAGAELLSSHRYRPLRTRLRTASTTFVVFGAATAVEALLRVSRIGAAGLPGFVRELRSDWTQERVAEWMGRAIEKLGLFVLPSNPFVTELAGLALAGAVFLLAMHPGLAAARSAPRLWGWVLFAWFLALLGSELFHMQVAVRHADLSRAPALLSSTAVVAVGLGIGSTALSGLRRMLYPCLVALGYAALAHANALPWRFAAQQVEDLRVDLLQVKERYGVDLRILVVDPPDNTRGLAPVGSALAALAHPALESPRIEGQESGPPTEVYGLTKDAFLAFVEQAEFDELRSGGLAVIFPAKLVELSPAEDATPDRIDRRTILYPPPNPSGRPQTWRGTLRSPNLDLEAARTAALLIRAPRDPNVGKGERVSWRSRERSLPDGSLTGFWYRSEGSLNAVFDVGSSIAWRLGDRIKRVWFDGDLASVDEVMASASLPDLWPASEQGAVSEIVPFVADADWSFPEPTSPFLTHVGDRGSFHLLLLDLRTLELREWPALREAGGGVRVPGVAHAASERAEAFEEELVWRLELEVEGTVVARREGRLRADPEAR